MKTKKILIVAMMSGMFMLFSGVARADYWKVCTIVEAGYHVSSQVAYVRLVEKTGTAWSGGRWFVSNVTDAKSILAVALTGLSNGHEMNVPLSALTEWSTINGLFERSQDWE